MATDHGVAVIDPRKIQLNMQPPAVVIEGLVVDDTELSVGGPVVVPRARIGWRCVTRR